MIEEWRDCNFLTKFNHCQLKKGSLSATNFCSRESCIFIKNIKNIKE